jgi:hypothetical protein
MVAARLEPGWGFDKVASLSKMAQFTKIVFDKNRDVDYGSDVCLPLMFYRLHSRKAL